MIPSLPCPGKQSVRRIILGGFFLLFALIYGDISIADEHLRSQIDDTEMMIAEVAARKSKLERDILFEQAWQEKLEGARTTIEQFLNDINTQGESWDDLKRIAKAHGKRVLINSQLKPYFFIDRDGNFHWGSALQNAAMLSGVIPQQFVAGFPSLPPLAPDEILAKLKNWQERNQAKMDNNKQEMAELVRMQETFSQEKQRLEERLAREQHAEEERQQEFRALLKNTQGKVATLEEFVSKLQQEIRKYKTEYELLKVEMVYSLTVARKSKSKVSGSSEDFHNCDVGLVDWKTGMVANLAQEIRENVSDLKEKYNSYVTQLGSIEEIAANTCNYASQASADPPPGLVKIKEWQQESAARINAIEKARKELSGSLQRLNEARVILNKNFVDLKPLLPNLITCAASAKEITRCRDNMTRVREIQNLMKATLMSLNQSKTLLDGGLERQLSAVRSLEAKSANVADAELREEVYGLQERLGKIRQTLDDAELNFPVVPFEEINCDSPNQDILAVSESKIQPLKKAWNEGEAALIEAEGAILKVTKTTESKQLAEARGCLEELMKIASLPPSMNDLERALGKAEALRADLVGTNARMLATDELCKSARELRESMEGQLTLVRESEQKVIGTLEAAEALAARCPDVTNPENIKTLYEKAEELTVSIGSEVVMLKNDKYSVAEKISIAETEFEAAAKEANTAIEQLDSLYAITEKIATSLYTEANPTWNEFVSVVFDARSTFAEIQNRQKCDVQPADELFSRAETSYAEALTRLGAHDGLVEQANNCVAGDDEQEGLHGEAMAAIDSCDLDKAGSLMNSMTDGDKKTEVVNAYTAAEKLEAELKVLVNKEAKGKYRQCDYDGALEILNKAFGMAKCQAHREKINKSIGAAEKGKILEAELKKMVNVEAKGKYLKCDYDGALEILNNALALAKCYKHKEKINKSIAAARKGKKLETELQAMVKDAGAKYDLCLFDEANTVVDAALAKAKCERHVTSLNEKKKKIWSRQQREKKISSDVQNLLHQQQSGSTTEALAKLNSLLGDTRCNDNRNKINNAIAQVESWDSDNQDGNGDISTGDNTDGQSDGEYSCTIQTHLTPPTPENTKVCWKILSEDISETNRVMHMIKYSQGHPIVKRLSPRGGFMNWLCMSTEGYGTPSQSTVRAEAEKSCNRWLAANQQQRNSRAQEPSGCRIVFKVTESGLPGTQAGGWECVCDAGEPTREACCAAPGADEVSERQLYSYRNFMRCGSQ